MVSDYLLKEYDECFEQLRFYDTRQETLTKYLYTLASAVVTAEFALHKYAEGASFFYFGLGALSFVVFVATVLIYAGMLENRAYFVFAARQINAIRGYSMADPEGGSGFNDNQMYTSVDLLPFRLGSLHTVCLVGAVFTSTIFAGATVYGLAVDFGVVQYRAITAAGAAIVGVLELAVGVVYLVNAGRETSNGFLGPRGRV